MSNNKRKCNKFEHDKYYTPQHVVDYVVKKTIEIVGSDFDCVVEPSAGNGAFIQAIEDSFKGSKKVYMDLYPDADGVAQQDYLKYEHKHEGKTLVIGNPPFGARNTLSVRFFKKSIQFADCIVYVLPISQLNNNQQMYEFDLVYSEDLGVVQYSNNLGDLKEVPSCLNIYKRPVNDTFNGKVKYKFKNFKILDYRKSLHEKPTRNLYSFGICKWGSVGSEFLAGSDYAQGMFFAGDITIIDFLKSFDFTSICSNTATPALYVWQVYEEVKKHFNLIEGDFDENNYRRK